MKPREIISISRDPDRRMLVTTHDGGVNVICGPDRPASAPEFDPDKPSHDPHETAEEAAEAGRPWIAPADASGQVGVLFDERRSGRVAPRGARIFVDPYQPRAHAALWTADDLDREARRYLSSGRLPAPERAAVGAHGRTRQRTSEPTWQSWIGDDPIRARAVWLHLAEQRHVSTEQALRLFGEALRARAVIVDAGWLSQADLDKL